MKRNATTQNETNQSNPIGSDPIQSETIPYKKTEHDMLHGNAV